MYMYSKRTAESYSFDVCFNVVKQVHAIVEKLSGGDVCTCFTTLKHTSKL